MYTIELVVVLFGGLSGALPHIRNREVLASDNRGRILVDALEAALNAVDPHNAVSRVLRSNNCLRVGDREYRPHPQVYVVGFGKAARGMAEAVLSVLGGKVEAGLVIAPRGMGGRVGPIEVLEGDHPIPGENTLKSSLRLLEFVEQVPPNSVLLVLVSGGGSALFEVPADDISLRDIAITTDLLLRSGADIYELNAVRKHLSRVKGGQLLRYTNAAAVETIIISDVMGDRLDTIASGPTVPDETTFEDAWRILEKYRLVDKVPKSVRDWLQRGLKGKAPETPKPGDTLFSKSHVVVAARNLDALRAAAEALESYGVKTIVLTDTLRGEAREAAKTLAAVMEASMKAGTIMPGPPAAVVAGGETTVTVRGGGKGGRCQELVLSLAIALRRVRILDAYKAACMGTDGVDGNSPVAGAVADETTIPRALGMGLNPVEYLEENNSYEFFTQLGTVIDTGGHTGTNVNDVFIGLVGHDKDYRLEH